MRKYIFIGLGGILGAILRYYIKNIHINNYNLAVPLNTFIINITGSFALALILTIALEIYEFDSDIRLGIGTGFIGAYTTFSTMCKEAVLLISSGYYYLAISYITVSTILGLGAVYLGVLIAREVVAKIVEVRRYKAIAEAEIASDVEEGGK